MLDLFELRKKVMQKCGIEYPYALTPNEWDKWNRTQRKNSKCFKIIENIFDFLDTITRPLDWLHQLNVSVYLYFYKTSYMDTELPRTKWHDLDQKMLFGMFNEFQKFVEHELYLFDCLMSDLPIPRRIPIISWFSKEPRNPEAGIAFLKKCIAECIDDPEGRRFYQEVYDLYQWWIEYKENDYNSQIPNEEQEMLHRLIDIRLSLWT